MITILRGLLATAFLSSMMSIQAQSLVVNGDFQGGTAGWTGCGALERNPETVYGGSNGANFTAEVDAAANLCQVIPGFTIGQQYTLTLLASRRTGGCPGPDPLTVNIVVDGGALSTSITRAGAFNLSVFTITFTATQVSHTLTLLPAFGGTTCGMIIDDISIVALPLSISPLVLNASRMDTSVALSWEIEDSDQFDQIHMQRNTNGNEWQTILSVDLASHHSAGNRYAHTDFPGTVEHLMYRLVKVGGDGGNVFSEVVLVDNSRQEMVMLYPNPATDAVTVVASEEIISVKVAAADGRIVQDIANPDGNILFTGLPSGMYHVIVFTPSGLTRLNLQLP